jgi:ClpP class serine protease
VGVIDSVLEAVRFSGQMQIAALAAMVLLPALAVFASWRYGRAVRSQFDLTPPPAAETDPGSRDDPGEVITRGVGGNPWSDAIRRLEEKRNSHVVGFIHYLSADSDQGITDFHLQDLLWSLRDVPPAAPLDIILHSLGGEPGSIQQIARAIKAHKGPTTVFVPYYAHGLTSLIALAADHIVMGRQAGLSFPQASDREIETLIKRKGVRNVDDETLIRLHMQRNWSRELAAFVQEVSNPGAKTLAHHLLDETRSISTPIGAADLKKLGLAVTTDMPGEVDDVIEACQCFPNFAEEAKLSRQSGGPRSEALVREGETADIGWCQPSCHAGVAPLLRAMQTRRGSSAICVVHGRGMESAFVDMTTAKDVLRALSMADASAPLDIILHTPGGFSFHGWQIARAIKAHKGRKTVFVPHFAWSAGTIIALAADEIVMSDDAALGPIDTQMNGLPASAWASVLKLKPRNKIDDVTTIFGQRCERQIKHDHRNALELMKGVYAPAVAERIVHTLNDGTLTHGYPITFRSAQRLGLKVTNAMPPEPEQIVHEFRDPALGYRSVIFCSSQ